MVARGLRHTSTYSGIERPGKPVWKSMKLGELIWPVTLATTLKFAPTFPSSATQRSSNLSIFVVPSTQYDTPKVNPNSAICGGISEPAASAPRLTVTSTSAPTSREIDAVRSTGFAELAGQSMLWLNRFVTPEKLTTGIGFDAKVLLNEPTALGAGTRACKKRINVLPRANEAGSMKPHGPFIPWVRTSCWWILSRELASDRTLLI